MVNQTIDELINRYETALYGIPLKSEKRCIKTQRYSRNHQNRQRRSGKMAQIKSTGGETLKILTLIISDSDHDKLTELAEWTSEITDDPNPMTTEEMAAAVLSLAIENKFRRMNESQLTEQ